MTKHGFQVLRDLLPDREYPAHGEGTLRTGCRPGKLGLAFLTAFLLFPSVGLCEEAKDVPTAGEAEIAETSIGEGDQIDAWKEYTLEEIVVTATRTEKALSDVPAAVSVVTREGMENRNIQTIDSAVNLIPGVFDKRAKGLDTTAAVTLRGFPGQKRTLVLVDGQPQNDGYTGAVNWNGILPENVEKIEVARGPFSSLYGGNAMGGVVNILTRMPEKREVILKEGYGNDDYWTNYGSYGDRWFDRLSLFTSYGYQSSNGYPNNLLVKTPTTPGVGTPTTGGKPTTDPQGNPAFLLGDRGDNTWWRDSGTFKLACDINDRSRVNFSFMRNRWNYDYDDPHTYLTGPDGKPVWSGSVIVDGNRLNLSEGSFLESGGGATENKYHLGYETGLFGDAVLKLTCGLVDQESNWYVTPSSTANRFGGPGKLNETPSKAVYTDAQISFPIFEKHRLTFGAGFRYDEARIEEHDLINWRDEDSKAALTYESRGKDNIFSFYSQAEISLLRNVTAYLGIRGDLWQTYDGMVNLLGAVGVAEEFGSRDAFEVSPKASLVYKPFEATTLRASAGRAFRPPSVYELYRTWVFYGTTYAANPHLDPETSLSWDVGLEQRLGESAVFRVNYFNNHIYDIIYRQDVSPTLKQLINAGEAQTDGIEFEMEHRVNRRFKYFGSFTYTHSEMLDNPAKPSTVGKRLVGVPEWMYGLGGEITYGPASLTVTGRYVDKQYNNDENLDTAKNVYGVYDSFFLADVNLRYQVNRRATVNFAVNNLLDETYFTYYRSPGRTFFGGLTLKF